MRIAPVKIALIRHGQSIDNTRNVFVGAKTDSRLSELGVLQAEATGSYLVETVLGAPAIYSSPLVRALDTAAIISKRLGVPLKIDLDLVEFDFGELDGLAPEEAYAKYPEMDHYWGPTITEPIPGGESAAAVAKRVSNALMRIAASHSPGETVIVVSHQGAITMGLAAILDEKKEFMRLVPSNCSVTWIEMGPESRLTELNYIGHLMELGNEDGKIL
jgi:broad specificity phosphatase PhoE